MSEKPYKELKEGTMTSLQIENCIAVGFQLGYKMALIDCGEIKPYLSRNEASRKYGKAKVSEWILQNKVTTKKGRGKTSTVWCKRIDLEKADAGECRLLKY